MSKALETPRRDSIYVLVTGTNSGLGLATCCRLIDEFLDSRPAPSRLVLIITTRDTKKGQATQTVLKRHLSKHRLVRAKLPVSDPRVFFRLENLELTSLVSVKNLSERLRRSAIPRLDALILNASLAGDAGLNWPKAVWLIATDLVQALTWPTYKLTTTGMITSPQLPSRGEEKNTQNDEDGEPVLGQIFCANVLGHYMLAHWLMPLLRACPQQRPGRIIWVSSISGDAHHFNRDDLQTLESLDAYEHTKRMTDLMAMTTSRQPATAKPVSSFIDFDIQHDRRFSAKSSNSDTYMNPNDDDDLSPFILPPPSTPSIFAAHPGICATSIITLPWLFQLAMKLVFYLARWFGSPWHNVSAYTGATASVWLALADPAEIADRETPGAAKWGSAVTRLGGESVQRTDTPGWGVCGDGERVEWWNKRARWLAGSGGAEWGRKRNSKDATREDVERFVDEGAQVWMQMEELRVQWERRIERYPKK